MIFFVLYFKQFTINDLLQPVSRKCISFRVARNSSLFIYITLAVSLLICTRDYFLTVKLSMSSFPIPFSYFVPEDGDVEDYPNVFLAPKPRQQGQPPTLGQVKSAFPLPGRYHFRFKSPLVPGGDRDKGSMAVWMDCVDDRQPVPSWRGTVVAKVTRLAAEDDDDDDDDEDFHRPPAATPAPAPPPATRVPPPAPTPAPAPAAAAPALDIFGGPSPMSHQSATNSGNIFQSSPAPAPALGSGDLLGDMHTHTSYGGQPHNDFLGMTSPPTSGGLTPQQQHQMHQQQQQQQQQMYPGTNMRAPPRHSGSFDSFGGGSQGGGSGGGGGGGSSGVGGGAFGGLGTPWKN